MTGEGGGAVMANLAKRLLNIKDEEPAGYLRAGNELCKPRIPMSPQLITKVNSIYRKCQLALQKEDATPVMLASALGLADMVWGFIECSKETTTNLHTQTRSEEPLEFLWHQNRSGDTALDMAISSNHMEVAKILLTNASYDDLASAWHSKGKILLPLLDDTKHDGFIFDMLEKDTRRRADQVGLTLMHNEPIRNEQETILYLESLEQGQRGWDSDLNTNILHIVSKLGDVTNVKYILGKESKNPDLIWRANILGETPVYVAAKEGHLDVLQIMFDYLKEHDLDIERFVIKHRDKHNALHIAIQNHHVPVVFWLLEKIPQLANYVNHLNESPLYLAAERSYFGIVKLILTKCRDKTFTGPNGKTALHAAAISNSAECVKYLLAESPHLLDEKDENDWTPFHYAVNYNSSLAMKELLNVDRSIGNQLVTKDDTITSALHIAASRGHWEIMKVLMSMCPGIREFDSKGRNILHVAIESKQTKVTEFIFQDESLISLINQKDNNGNTPVHLLASWNFELLRKVIDSRVDIHSLNNESHTPLDMIDSDENKERLIKAIAMGTNISNKRSSSSPNIRMNDSYKKESEGKQKESESKQKESEAYFKIVDNLVLVVTLIATATFAAAFTVPGGFDSDNGSKQGTPYLLRKVAFQTFVITNAIAFSCSTSVLLTHIVLLFYRNRYGEVGEAEQRYIQKRMLVMYFLTGVALLAMLIAFVTGFYVVLLPSLWLAILVCALSICIVVVSLII